jgi:hypothetical protein
LSSLSLLSPSLSLSLSLSLTHTLSHSLTEYFPSCSPPPIPSLNGNTNACLKLNNNNNNKTYDTHQCNAWSRKGAQKNVNSLHFHYFSPRPKQE